MAVAYDPTENLTAVGSFTLERWFLGVCAPTATYKVAHEGPDGNGRSRRYPLAHKLGSGEVVEMGI